MKRVSAVLLAALVAAYGPVATGQSEREQSLADAARINARLGIEYMRDGNLAVAQEKIEKALEQNDRDAGVQMGAGLLYEQLRDPKKAEQHYRRALRLDPDNPQVQNALGAFLCRNGEAEKGEEMFLTAAVNPLYRTPEVAYTNAGVCARQNGHLQRAEEHLRRAVSSRTPYPEALLQMAGVSFERANYLQARAFLQRYLDAAAAGADVLMLGYQVERALGDTVAADAYARRVRTEFPESAEARRLEQESSGGAP
jgi:type IV pilus assembly protein PilF